MLDLSPAHVDALLSALTQNLPALAELFQQSFEHEVKLSCGPAQAWSATADLDATQRSGLVFLFDFGGEAAACTVPMELLPQWMTQLSHDNTARLQTVALEFARHAFPIERHVSRVRTTLVGQVGEFVVSCAPAEDAVCVTLSAEGVESPCILIWPLQAPQFEELEVTAAEIPELPTARVMANPLARLRGIPVPISVRLAEKRIPVSQLLGITPGALITFSKSCEDLLDLYVNNALFCRGEAVKVGENFGLKINQLGVSDEAPSRLVQN